MVAGGPIHSDIGAPGRGVPPCLPYRTAACRRSRLRRASTAPSDAVAAVARPRVSEAFEEDMMGVDAAKPLRRRLIQAVLLDDVDELPDGEPLVVRGLVLDLLRV